MMRRKFLQGVVAMFSLSFAALGCSKTAHAGDSLPAPKVDVTYADKSKLQTAVFAGGCFWCTEGVFEQLLGVPDVTSGYSGGAADTANYERVCMGDTGHAESIKITYDPSKITYGQLLMVFFSTHDPTTLNRQGNDAGTQYRSAIFYANDEEKKVAEAYIAQLTDIHAFPKPIVTSLEPLKAFYPAEAYHQNYVCNNPHNPYIVNIALPKVDKVREKFPDKVKPTTQPQQ
jgi:peptide-methionine (S)-S-oxide reductase